MTVLRLAEVIAGDVSVSPAFDRLTSTDQSRKGGSILAGLATALRTAPSRANDAVRHVVCYTDADLSANLAQLGSPAARIVSGDGAVGALGQRYGVTGSVLVRGDAPVAPVTGEAGDLLSLVRNLDLADYVTLIECLRVEDAGDPTLFERRWSVRHLRDLLRRRPVVAGRHGQCVTAAEVPVVEDEAGVADVGEPFGDVSAP